MAWSSGGGIIGAGATVVVTALQRTWQVKDKARERQEVDRQLLLSRGEEVLQRCQEVVDWKESARKVASTAEGQGFVPIQAPMFRIAAIVELFFPELSDQAHALDNSVLNYLHSLRGIAMLMHAGTQVSQPHVKALRDQQAGVELSLGLFQEAARKGIRARLNALEERVQRDG